MVTFVAVGMVIVIGPEPDAPPAIDQFPQERAGVGSVEVVVACELVVVASDTAVVVVSSPTSPVVDVVGEAPGMLTTSVAVDPLEAPE